MRINLGKCKCCSYYGYYPYGIYNPYGYGYYPYVIGGNDNGPTVTVGCCPNPLSLVKYFTLSSLNCAMIDGLTIRAVYNSITGCWYGQTPIPCDDCNIMTANLCCSGSVWSCNVSPSAIAPSDGCGVIPSGGGSSLNVVSCSPFYATYSNNFYNRIGALACCAGSPITYTAVITD